jgi:hypothetical protein
MEANEKLRGWIRASTKYAAKSQRKRLTAYGCGALYEHGTDTLSELIRDLRPADLVIVTSLARLAPTRPALMKAMAEIHKINCAIVEVGRSDKDVRNSLECDERERMIFDAVDELAGDRRTHTTPAATEYGKLGGKKKGENAAAARTPVAMALSKWRDLSITAAEALATPEMAGWSTRAAYRPQDEGGLGPRNTAPGRHGRPRKIR